MDCAHLLAEVDGAARHRVFIATVGLACCLASAPGRAATITVHVFNFDFSANPSGQPIVDPTISLGDTVHWVWDSGSHSTTAAVDQLEFWDSGTHSGAFNFDHTFENLGTFNYYCIPHGADLGGGNVSGMAGSITVVPAPVELQAGDSDQDLDFDQIDLVKVQIAAKYLTGSAATWGDGDWNGAPGGAVGNPPAGNGFFDQLDIIAALSNGLYLTGPYAAMSPNDRQGDEQTSYVTGPEPSTIALLGLGLVGVLLMQCVVSQRETPTAMAMRARR